MSKVNIVIGRGHFSLSQVQKIEIQSQSVLLGESMIAAPDAELLVDHLKSPDIQKHNGIGAGLHVL